MFQLALRLNGGVVGLTLIGRQVQFVVSFIVESQA